MLEVRLRSTSTGRAPAAGDLTDDQAWALAELCKRIGYSDCESLAVDSKEAHTMIDATSILQGILTAAGYAVR